MAIFSLEDRTKFWKFSGLLGGILMIYFSKSRMSLVGLAVCVIVPRMMPYFKTTKAWLGLAGLASLLSIFGMSVLNSIKGAVEGFKNARVSSSRVRDTIQSIGFHRWQTEAPWFGHGTVTRGPHIVEYMPIGSHHTWYGLLFVKGIVGLFSLLLPFAIHMIQAVIDAVRGPRGRLPLALMLNFMILTFGENIEIEVYLLWPAFVMLGIHTREMMSDNA